MKKSLLGNKWLLPETEKEFFEQFFESRKIEDKESFLNTKFPEDLVDESLLPDSEKAAERLEKAIKNKERIVVFGDYDCDGIPGTAICVEVLQKLGAEVSYRIPHREKDGYGLKNYFLDELAEKNVKVVVTVDNGIASFEEAKYAKKLGIDLVITDHHEVQDGVLPEAYAVVNPQRQEYKALKEICGAVVAWKLMIFLAKKMKGENWANENVRDEYLELAALSTVADIMPLKGENRAIVKAGLKKIRDTKNLGLLALFDEMGHEVDKEITADFFGFQLGPRINASGRMSHGHFAVQLLLGETKHAPYLEELNKERKTLVNEILEELEKNFEGKKELVMLENENWPSGVIGLIAGKIQEKFKLPSIVLQRRETELVASCRAPEGFNIFELLSLFKEDFSHFGGHAQACGFSIPVKNFENFKKKVKEKGDKLVKEIDLEKVLQIDFKIQNKGLDLDFAKKLKILEPHGKGNESPVFLIEVFRPEIFLVGEEKQHLSLKSGRIRAIGFGFGRFFGELKKAEKIELAVEISINKWKEQDQLKLQILDLRI